MPVRDKSGPIRPNSVRGAHASHPKSTQTDLMALYDSFISIIYPFLLQCYEYHGREYLFILIIWTGMALSEESFSSFRWLRCCWREHSHCSADFFLPLGSLVEMNFERKVDCPRWRETYQKRNDMIHMRWRRWNYQIESTTTTYVTHHPNVLPNMKVRLIIRNRAEVTLSAQSRVS